jgi:putative hydrolase of the HAD superfamily
MIQRGSYEFEAVLFDLYDTLVWSALPPAQDRLSMRIGVTEETLWRAFAITRPARHVGAFASAEGDMAAIVRACGVEANPDFVRELTTTYLAFLMCNGVQLYDETLPVLRKLRSCGLKTAIISNCDHWTRPVVTALALEHEVDEVFLSFEVGVKKPDAEIYRVCLERLAARPERTAFVDDQANYCDGARAVGICPYLLVRNFGCRNPHSGPYQIIDRLDNLL